jgi:IPT/TIG domain
MRLRTRKWKSSRAVPVALLAAALAAGCGGGASSNDWYYHWNCNGDSECLALNPGAVNQPSGTVGPEAGGLSGCNSLMTFGTKFWNIPPATQSCDNSPTTPLPPPPPAPTITSFTPVTGSPGSSVTITGTNFSSGSTVSINGISAGVTSASATQILITIPAMGSYTGPFVVTAPGGSVTSGSSFSVTVPGVSWSAAAVTGVYRSVAWADGLIRRYAAVGDNIITSTDTVTWVQRLNTVPVPALSAIVARGSQFVAVGVTVTSSCCYVGAPGGVRTSSSGTILTTFNDATWTSQASGTARQLAGATWSGSQLVTVGAAGVVLTSPDSSTWTARASGATSQLNGVAWSAGQATYVAVGASGTALTSPDGTAWTMRTSGTATNLNGVAWCSSQFVAVGDGGALLTSPDGAAWTTRNSTTTNALHGVACSATQVVAIGDGGTILSSADGITWSARASGTTNALYGVAWSGGYVAVPPQFIAVGDGVILTSK